MDARISTALPSHHKSKKLIRRLGHGGAWHLVCLFLWAAANRPSGDLAGMSDEDVELAVDWGGEHGSFVAALAEVGFLDGPEGARSIHDWAEHNPWVVGAPARSEASRWAALCRRYGDAGAAERMPDYAERMRSAREAHADRTPVAENRSAPLPIPNPLPIPDPNQKPPIAPNGGAPTADCTAILDAYHRLLPKCARISVLNQKRKRRIAAAVKLAKDVCATQQWDYDPRAFWDSYFGECQGDAWLRGEVANPKNAAWKQNLDVLLAEDRFAGIMDRAIAALREASP